MSEEDIQHAYVNNPIKVFGLDEGLTLVIGANPAVILLEVGVVEGATAPVVVHPCELGTSFEGDDHAANSEGHP